MIIRREVFDDIGLLDEGYFTYFDDIDFCFNAANGWPSWYVPASRVVHLVGQSTGIDATRRRLPPYLLEARRRYFQSAQPGLCGDGRWCHDHRPGLSLARPFLTGKSSDGPPHLMRDSFRHSVFLKGFKLTDVELPTPPPSEALGIPSGAQRQGLSKP